MVRTQLSEISNRDFPEFKEANFYSLVLTILKGRFKGLHCRQYVPISDLNVIEAFNIRPTEFQQHCNFCRFQNI